MARSKDQKELDKIYRELRDANNGSYSSESNDLLRFFIGLLLLGGGLFMILQNINVTSNWGGYFFHIGSFHLANGMIMLPAIVGIGMLFLMDRKIFGWIVLSIGIVIILLSVLLTTHLEWRRTNAYIFIIMFGMVAAGGGIVIRELFKQR
jgi:hypothetical protein